MQMLEDALLPERLDDMRKMLRPEMARDDAEFIAQHQREARERREALDEQQDRNRHERRRRLALERLGK